MNFWMKLSAARRIAAEIQIKYCGVPSDGKNSIEDEMIDFLCSHSENPNDDMYLIIHWDDTMRMSWVQVGFFGFNQLVPR